MSTHVPHPRFALVSVALAALVAGTGGYAATSTHQVSSPAPHTAAVTQTQPIDVTVTASEFKLSPSPLVVAVGRTVRLTFADKGVSIHNWTVQGLAARGVRLLSAPTDLAPGFAAEMHTAIAHGIPFVAANPGERAMVEFTPLHAGTYKILCTIRSPVTRRWAWSVRLS